jgi:enoyl-CoA hydratase
VISSSGKHFSAGMDMTVFTSGAIKHPPHPARRNEHMRQRVLQLQAIINTVKKCAKYQAA